MAGQVRLGLHAVLAQGEHRGVAVAPLGHLDDEHEPAAHVAARVLAGQPEPLLRGELGAARSRYQRGDAGARREHVVEALELGEAERAGEVGEAVVEAEPVVVEPAHVGRPALVALGVDLRLVLGGAHGDHAALARGELLVGVEAEHGRVPARAHGRPVGVDRAERLAGVLHDRQAVALERRDVGRVAEDVDGQERAWCGP